LCCDANGRGVEGHSAGGSALDLVAGVESLLFVADEPVSVDRLAEALEVTPGQVERALEDLEAAYTRHGLRLQRAGSRVQLVTAPEAALYIERFLGLEARTRLSQAALETLAIVAYRQPITRPEIEAVRGVSSDSVLRTLVGVGLVEEVGRAPTVGRPILYGTTFEFLQHFGLSSLDALPPLGAVPSDVGADADCSNPSVPAQTGLAPDLPGEEA
jgi:segregation and condensation protein B